jgi:hypothetical protein
MVAVPVVAGPELQTKRLFKAVISDALSNLDAHLRFWRRSLLALLKFIQDGGIFGAMAKVVLLVELKI